MGGSEVHTKVSGVADLEVADDAECLDVVKRYLSFFPANNTERPPLRETEDPSIVGPPRCTTSCPPRRAGPTTWSS